MRMILIAAFAVAGCMASSPAANVADNAPDGPNQSQPREQRPADLPGHAYGGLNETIRLGDLTIKPLEVIEDSRCPVDVDCVWSGRLVLRAEVSGVDGPATISSLEPFALPGGGALVLASVWPPNYHQGGGPREPYRFGFTRR